MKQLPLPIGPDVPRSFDNFLTGRNALALEQLRLHGPGMAPIYLWGPTGSGKTHLLDALCDELQARQIVVARFGPATPLPWTVPDGAGLIVLDDCDRLDADREYAAFALFVDAGSLGIAFASAGRVPPVDLPLRDHLRSRLGWGHVVALQPLSEAEVRSALTDAGKARGIHLSTELIDYLLVRFDRDLKHLTALLERLDTFGIVTQREITIPLLRRMLAEEGTA